MANRDTMAKYMNELLEIEQFKDYGPNGLQVEGKAHINKVVCGVTASLALIQAAIDMQADAIIVHHGLFWKGQDGRVVGWMKQRLSQLLAHNINVYAYHLPLDAHPTLGNNAMLGSKLGLKVNSFTGEYGLLALGETSSGQGISLEALAQTMTQALQKEPTVIAGDDRLLRHIGWCSGGAQGAFEQAIAAGMDAYITGEISEPQAHYAREMGIAYLAGGHHATERYGVQALTEKVALHFGFDWQYIEIDNPA